MSDDDHKGERPPSSPDALTSPGHNPSDSAAGERASERAAVQLPDRIGRYRILRILGEGGMGTVYEAEQESPRRTVALKVIKPNLATRTLLRRFEMESHVLGLLQHPGIAQIYEAGTADMGHGPQPFFAMELVTGQSLLDYVRDHDLGTRKRLELLAKVCDAVQHAHQKGVIHRDLKPGNILVDEHGQPKILDFGVARTTDADIQVTMQTDVGQLVGTLPYMSPEQVAAKPEEMDTRSDVYALGVVLYEVLAGRLPYEIGRKMLHEAVRVIREKDPAPLSTINRVFRGDVETIAAKALEKERDRRYQSAAELAGDIRRYLNEEPIAARPPSTAYQLRKFARRNRALVAGVGATIVALATGGIIATWQAVRAHRAELSAKTSAQQATREADKARSVNGFLQDMLASANPANTLGREMTVREMLDESARKLDSGGLQDQPEAAANAHLTLGQTYRSLGEYTSAAAQIKSTIRLRQQIFGPHHPETAEAENSLAVVYIDQSRFAQADSLASQALSVLQNNGGRQDQIAASLSTLGTVAYNRGDYPRAEALQKQALQIKRGLPGDHRDEIRESLGNIAFVLQQEGKGAEAEPLAREGLSMAREVHGAVHPDVLNALVQLADVLLSQQQLQSELQVLQQADSLSRRLYPGDHPERADVLIRLGRGYMQLGDLEAAQGPLREAMEMRRRVLGENHKDTAFAIAANTDLCLHKGDYAAAEKFAREALAIREKVLGKDNPGSIASRSDLAQVLRAKGDLEGAEALGRQVIEQWRANPGNERYGLVPSLHFLALLLQQKGDLDGAAQTFSEALKVCRETFGEDDATTAQALDNLGSCLYRKKEVDRATELMTQALATRRKLLAPGNPGLLVSLGNVAYLLEAKGDTAAAEPLYREYVTSALTVLPADNQTVEKGTLSLTRNLLAQKKWVEAERATRERITACDKTHDKDCANCALLRSRLGLALNGARRFADAEQALSDAFERMHGASGVSDDAKRTVIEALVAACEGAGKQELAQQWRGRLEPLAAKPSKTK